MTANRDENGDREVILRETIRLAEAGDKFAQRDLLERVGFLLERLADDLLAAGQPLLRSMLLWHVDSIWARLKEPQSVPVGRPRGLRRALEAARLVASYKAQGHSNKRAEERAAEDMALEPTTVKGYRRAARRALGLRKRPPGRPKKN